MHALCVRIYADVRACLFYFPTQVPGIVLNVTVAPADKNGQRAISISGTVGIAGRAGDNGENGGSSAAFPGTTIPNTTTHVPLRVLVDRSSAEAFILDGRQAYTICAGRQQWAPTRTASGVALFGSAGTAVTGTLHAMGCGWVEAPTL